MKNTFRKDSLRDWVAKKSNVEITREIKIRIAKFWKSFEWISIKDVKGNGKVIRDVKGVLWKSYLKRVWDAYEKAKSYWKRETLNATLFVMKSWHWALRE